MPRLKKRIHQPYEEAKEYVRQHGTKVMKLRCPFCAWVRNLTETNVDTFYPIYRYEEPLLLGCLAGRGGVFKFPELSQNLSQLKGQVEWKPLLDEIRMKAKEILEELGEEEE